MRRKLVELDVVECVLGLGPNLFYNSPMEACVVVCQWSRPVERRGKVLFIQASKEVTRERAQSFLTEEHIRKIIGAYHAWEDIAGFARVASAEVILERDSNLTIPLYVRPVGNANGASDGKVALAAAIAEWQESSIVLRASMDELFKSLEGAGIGN